MLRRHLLARPTRDGWRRLCAGDWDAGARACLEHWAQSDLPLVVTRRHGEPGIRLGLPVPRAWGRRHLTMRLPAAAIATWDEFPPARAIAPLLALPLQGHWLDLCGRLEPACRSVRVYGSHGWQWITGLPYLHEQSDLDLLIAVDGTGQAERVCELLAAAPPARPRLDGELVFGDGAGIAWREWLQWRRGGARQMLVKRLDAVALETWPEPC